MKLNDWGKKAIAQVCNDINADAVRKTQKIMSIIFPDDDNQDSGSPSDNDQKLNDPNFLMNDPDYLRGFEFGKQYAEYMFKHLGIRPDVKYDIPFVDDIKIKVSESLNEAAGNNTFNPDNKNDYAKAIYQILVKSFTPGEAANQIYNLIDTIVKGYNPEPEAGGSSSARSPFDPDDDTNKQNNQNQQGNQQGNQQNNQSGQGQNGQSGNDQQNGGGGGESGQKEQGTNGKNNSTDGSSGGSQGGDNNDENGENGDSQSGGSGESQSGNETTDNNGEKDGGTGGDLSGSDDSEEDMSGGISGEGDDGSDDLSDEAYDAISQEAEKQYGNGSVAMRNAGDQSGELKGSHVISKEDADEIRKELNAKETSTDLGATGTDEDVEELIDLKRGLDRMNGRANHKAGDAEDYKKTDGAFDAQIRKVKASTEGPIDWKAVFKDFTKVLSHEHERKHFRKNLAVRAGIYAKNSYRKRSDFEKCVVYVDTSGSAYGFVQVMIQELARLLDDCNFESMDVRLFSDSVYKSYLNLDPTDVVDGKLKIEVSSGGTSLDAVYKNISKKYCDEYGEINDGISAIVILTDVSGIWGTYVELSESDLDTDCKEKMFYAVYDESSRSREEVEGVVRDAIDEDSGFIIVCLENLISSLKGDESVSESMNEGRLEFSDYDNKDDNPTNEPKSEEDEEKIFKRLGLHTARLSGNYEGASPEIVATLKEYLPNVSPVSNEATLSTKENTYFIDDDEIVSIHMNLTNDNIQNFLLTCEKVKYGRLIGNVNISDITIENLPDSFPVEVDGDFSIINVSGITTLKHFPKIITGTPEIVMWSRRMKDDSGNYINTQKAIKDYISRIGKDQDYINRYKKIYERFNAANEYINKHKSKR